MRSFNKLFVPVFFYQTLNYVWMSENVAWWPSDATLANTPLALGTPAPPPNLCCSSSFCSWFRGWLCAAALFVVYDFFYSFFHRALHHRSIYKYIHKHHHQQVVPTHGPSPPTPLRKFQSPDCFGARWEMAGGSRLGRGEHPDGVCDWRRD